MTNQEITIRTRITKNQTYEIAWTLRHPLSEVSHNCSMVRTSRALRKSKTASSVGARLLDACSSAFAAAVAAADTGAGDGSKANCVGVRRASALSASAFAQCSGSL